MKKQLLAIAIGTAMAAPGAVLADSPEVYGKINLSWDNVEASTSHGTINPTDGAGNSLHQQEINSHQSYVGLRGSSELFPMGLTGFYQLEYQITPHRTTGFVNRESFLGMASDDFGTVKVGRFNSPNADLGRMVDQFSDYTWSDIAGMMRGQVRGRNYVGYSSPEFARMLTFNIAGPTSENNNVNMSNNNNHGLWDSFSSSLVFDLGGDIYAGLGYDKNLFQGDVIADGSLTDQGNNNFAQTSLETGANAVDVLRFVAGVKLDALELGFLWQNAKTIEEITVQGEQENGEEDSIVLSAGFMLTPDTKLMAQYVDTSHDNGDDMDSSQWTLGVDHRVGDRTKVYAYATQREAEGVDGAGDSISGRDVGVFSIGAEHRF